jgi:hypothetical protein
VTNRPRLGCLIQFWSSSRITVESINSNNDWEENNSEITRIQQTKLAPHDQKEPAIVATLQPGDYAVTVRVDRACKKVGAARITHHDSRHLFATAGSKAACAFHPFRGGLDAKDGGALAMKTYGHLRREQSIAQAQRVTFTPSAASAI